MENSINALDSEHLINEVGEVIKKGINDLLGGFSERYNMLEDTHNKIMNLPSVQYHLNGNTSASIYVDNCSTNMNDITTHISNLIESKLLQDNIKLQEKIDIFDNKINEYNDKYETLTNLVLELSENSNKLTKLVVELSENSNQKNEPLNTNVVISENHSNTDTVNDIVNDTANDNEDDDDDDNLSTDDESLTSETAIETENIKITINEENEEEESEQEEEEEEVEEEGEEYGGEIEEESVEEEKEKEENDEDVEEEDDEDVEEEEEDEDDDAEEEEEEVFSITINGKSYFTNDEKNGEIYEDIDDDIGDKVGNFKKGKAVFF